MAGYHTFPRPVKPELISVGDMIEAVYPEDGGITIRKRGTVHKIDVYAGTRLFLTREGAAIFQYAPGRRAPVKIMLLAREPATNEPLSMFDDLLELRA